MKDLDQVICGDCGSTYHREISPETIYFKNRCKECTPQKTEYTWNDITVTHEVLVDEALLTPEDIEHCKKKGAELGKKLRDRIDRDFEAMFNNS